jgi:hypothetical protein
MVLLIQVHIMRRRYNVLEISCTYLEMLLTSGRFNTVSPELHHQALFSYFCVGEVAPRSSHPLGAVAAKLAWVVEVPPSNSPHLLQVPPLPTSLSCLVF